MCVCVCVFSTDLDLSHLSDDDEAYDYKFVKWMIKEKVIDRFQRMYTTHNLPTLYQRAYDCDTHLTCRLYLR